MNIDDLTIGQVKELSQYFGNNIECKQSKINENFIGQYVIVRTYSAGVWFGKLNEKEGKEVILTEARRMYRWWAAQSISLSGVARYGIIHEKSKIIEALPKPLWIEAIEIILCSGLAIDSLKDAPNVKAE